MERPDIHQPFGAFPMLWRIGFKKLVLVVLVDLMFLHFCWLVLCKRVQSQAATVFLLIVHELGLARAVGLSNGGLHLRRSVIGIPTFATFAAR